MLNFFHNLDEKVREKKKKSHFHTFVFPINLIGKRRQLFINYIQLPEL